MEFIHAGEIIGIAHQVRTAEISDSPRLPDGEYKFVDMYCTDPSCDCRKTMKRVLYNGAHVSTINFGWEPPAFYEGWFGGELKDGGIPPMHGASIDITSPDRVSQDSILGLFKALLNEKWVANFKRNYRGVKAQYSRRKP